MSFLDHAITIRDLLYVFLTFLFLIFLCYLPIIIKRKLTPKIMAWRHVLGLVFESPDKTRERRIKDWFKHH